MVNFSLPILAGFGLKIFKEKAEEERMKQLIKKLGFTGALIVSFSFLFLILKPLLFPKFKTIIINMYYGKLPSFGLLKGAGGGETLDYYFGVMEKFFIFLKKSLLSFTIIFSSILLIEL